LQLAKAAVRAADEGFAAQTWDCNIMLRQFLMGFAISLCNIVIHALVMALIVRVTQFVGARKTLHPTLLLIAAMVATVSVLMSAQVALRRWYDWGISPAASARIHPVLRRSSPSNPSTNSPAFNAARSCANLSQ
jgi:hypothetical protein